MKDEKESFHERKMEILKKREELLKSMDEKELRAFIKGYMMAEHMTFKRLSAVLASDCGDCNGCCGGSQSCNCGSCDSRSCGCGKENCDCGK